MEDNGDYLDKVDHNLAPRRHNVNDGNGVGVTAPKWRLQYVFKNARVYKTGFRHFEPHLKLRKPNIAWQALRSLATTAVHHQLLARSIALGV